MEEKVVEEEGEEEVKEGEKVGRERGKGRGGGGGEGQEGRRGRRRRKKRRKRKKRKECGEDAHTLHMKSKLQTNAGRQLTQHPFQRREMLGQDSSRWHTAYQADMHYSRPHLYRLP